MEDEEGKRTNLITKERFLKGDLNVARDGAGYINSAQAADHSIFNALCLMDVADDGHVSAILTYLDWRDAYMATMGYKISKLFERYGTERSEDKSSKYLSLIRLLGFVCQRKVEEAIRPHDCPLDRAAVYEVRWDFIKPIERVGRTIREVNENFSENNACSKP